VQSYGSAVVFFIETKVALLFRRVGLIGFQRDFVWQIVFIWLLSVRDDILILFHGIVHRSLKAHVAHACLLVAALRRTHCR
jgi:hypothetical protein